MLQPAASPLLSSGLSNLTPTASNVQLGRVNDFCPDLIMLQVAASGKGSSPALVSRVAEARTGFLCFLDRRKQSGSNGGSDGLAV